MRVRLEAGAVKGGRPAGEAAEGGRGPSIDERLAELLARSPRGVCYTQQEIADAVGCSRAFIWYLEQQALRKMRRVLDRPGVMETLL